MPPLLTIDDLAVSFGPANASERARAVDGVRLSIHAGQTVALVGESGCGKSVTAMSILRLLTSPPAQYERGRIDFRTRSGEVIDLRTAPEKDMRAIRGAEIAMIFQEPMTSLNPVFTIGEQIVEAILLHQNVHIKEARERAADALTRVGITDAHKRLGDYPHVFSGGMRQRVMIAMALACNPSLLLADEPTTALDVTIQAQILDLLASLRESTGMGVLLITHDLGVVAGNADVVAVMYAGRIVEYASVGTLFENPMHPYTRGLFNCIPSMVRRRERLITVAETVDNPEEFRRLGAMHAGLVPWWPTHAAPEPTIGQRPDALVQVAPGHWVDVWDTAAAKALPRTHPDIAPPAAVPA